MEGNTITGVNIIGSSFTAVMAILFLSLPRRYALVPIMMTGCYLTLGQFIKIADFHFSMMRILVFIGWIRVLARSEMSSFRLCEIDKAIIAFVISNIIMNTIQNQTTEALINRLGFAYDALGTFFLFRMLLRDDDDAQRVFRQLALIIMPLAISMLVEKIRGENAFALLGGVPVYTIERDGRLRCQGPFSHPILAGTFGATLMPLMVSIWWQEKGSKSLALIGIIGTCAITFSSASSGPLMSFIIGVISLLLWPYRKHMREIRWSILFLILGLHMVMKASVWSLIGRVGHLVGGTGYHRVMLIDAAIEYFHEWWLFGTHYTAHWMPYALEADPNNADITNQFIREGVDGGLLTMLLFIFLIVKCFAGIGDSLKILEKSTLGRRFCLWAMGSTLMVHVATFISVRYFDQMIFYWYLLLSLISTVSASSKQAKTVVER